jgi:hypothetical protein
MLSQDTNHTEIFVAPQGISNGWANSNGRDVAFIDGILSREAQRGHPGCSRSGAAPPHVSSRP